MLKDQIKSFKNEIKLNNVGLTIQRIYNSYITSDKRQLFNTSYEYIELEEEIKANYLLGIKKILSGPSFKKTHLIQVDNYDKETKVIDDLLNLTNNFNEEDVHELENKILNYGSYDKDVFLSIIKFSLYDESYLACLISPIKAGNEDVFIDISNPQIKKECITNKIIKFATPLEGFIYPALIDTSVDINHAFYYVSNLNKVNMELIECVFNDVIMLNSQQEKENFSILLSNFLGGSNNIQKVYALYQLFYDKLEQDKESLSSTINKNEMKSIFNQANIVFDEKEFDELYDQLINDVPLNLMNLIPSKQSALLCNDFKINVSNDVLGKLSFVEDETGYYLRVPIDSVSNDVFILDGIEISSK